MEILARKDAASSVSNVREHDVCDSHASLDAEMRRDRRDRVDSQRARVHGKAKGIRSVRDVRETDKVGCLAELGRNALFTLA